MTLLDKFLALPKDMQHNTDFYTQEYIEKQFNKTDYKSRKNYLKYLIEDSYEQYIERLERECTSAQADINARFFEPYVIDGSNYPHELGSMYDWNSHTVKHN